MAKSRLSLSLKRAITLVLASGMTVFVLGCFASNDWYTGNRHMPSALWLPLLASVVLWCSYLAVTLRDDFREMLRPVESQLEEIDHEVGDYGDRCKAEGAAIAMQVFNQRRTNGTRHLNPVE